MIRETAQTTPEEREAQQKQKEQAVKDLRNAFNAVAETPEGQKVFQYLMDRCLWKRSLLGFSRENGVISPHNTEYNVARRDVWLELRQLFRWDLLNTIEMEMDPDANQHATTSA